ncbi:MAG: MBL fold metallo-hydrolase [Bacteroidales bacterium]|nr:MBL fold metallo-hydrolase [Bacteroidales bacterium]
MKLTVLGSSSLGNGYILEARNEAIAIEAGCRLSEVKKALGWDIRGLCGAVVTHRHGDHAAHVADFLRAGIRVMAPEDVRQTCGPLAGLVKVMEPNRGYRVGGFRIFAFPVCHDVPCMGYIIEHDEMGRMLFVTDTMMLEYTFPPMDHIMIEANYADDILEGNMDSGRVHRGMKGRLMGSHMELETTKGVLRANDLSQCRNIVLIHLSDGNSDEERFVREVRELTGIPTVAARPGLVMDVSKTPY